MSKEKKADLLLILITLFWGSSYYLTSICLEELPPFTQNAFRFLSAFILLGALLIKHILKINKITFIYSLIIGVTLVVVYIGATFGIKYTSLSNAGFICCLAVLITPFILFVFFRKKPGKKLFLSLVLCTIGLGLLVLNDSFVPAKGDLLCLLCAVFYSIDIIITERAVARNDVDPLGLGVCQLGVAGVGMTVLAFIFEKPALPKTPAVWASILFLGIVCSGITFIIQTVAQKWTTASHAALIFTLEPVFSAVIAYFIAGERLSARAYIGAVIMIISILITEISFKKQSVD